MLSAQILGGGKWTESAQCVCSTHSLGACSPRKILISQPPRLLLVASETILLLCISAVGDNFFKFSLSLSLLLIFSVNHIF